MAWYGIDIIVKVPKDRTPEESHITELLDALEVFFRDPHRGYKLNAMAARIINDAPPGDDGDE
jgi:hypothetical protein